MIHSNLTEALNVSKKKRIINREGDEYVCSFGYRWGIDEPDPYETPQNIKREIHFSPTSDEIEQYNFIEGLKTLFDKHPNTKITMFYTTGLAIQTGDETLPLESLSRGCLDTVYKYATINE